MERKNNTEVNTKQAEMALIQKYASQEGIAYDSVADSLIIDPFDGFFNEYFEDRRQQLIYGFISCYYLDVPRNDVAEASFAFEDNLVDFKYNLTKSREVASDTEATREIDSISLESVSRFVAFMHGKYLGQAQDELRDGHVGRDIMAKLVYWSRVDVISRGAGKIVVPTLDFEVE